MDTINKFDEKELVRMAASGDQNAFLKLFERYIDQIYTYILTFIPKPQDAEDICQETFHKAFKNIMYYQDEWAFSTWLYKIARNTAIDHYRKNSLTPYQSIDENREDATVSIDPSDILPSPEEDMINQQTFEMLIKAIKELDVKYRKVAELRFIHDYAYEEIARELNLPQNTVRTQIKRARKLLARKWKS